MPRSATLLRLALACACLAVPGWVAATRWQSLTQSHPAYPLLLIALAITGLVLALRIDRARPAGGGRRVGRGLGMLSLAVLLAVAAWLRPYAADDVAREAARPDGTVDVIEHATSWELRPTHAPLPVGLVFYPGALVDPQAYLALLRPLARDGHLVIVVKPPLGIALLDPWAAGRTFDAYPEVLDWVVGGHSLGGTAAASLAGSDPRITGLLLWASYPAGDLSGSPVGVGSISGTADGLTTPDDIARTRALLPPTTSFIAVPGAVHGFFGDYGDQAGDGTPGVTRQDAQQAIVAATSDFIDEVS